MHIGAVILNYNEEIIVDNSKEIQAALTELFSLYDNGYTNATTNMARCLHDISTNIEVLRICLETAIGFAKERRIPDDASIKSWSIIAKG